MPGKKATKKKEPVIKAEAKVPADDQVKETPAVDLEAETAKKEAAEDQPAADPVEEKQEEKAAEVQEEKPEEKPDEKPAVKKGDINKSLVKKAECPDCAHDVQLDEVVKTKEREIADKVYFICPNCKTDKIAHVYKN